MLRGIFKPLGAPGAFILLGTLLFSFVSSPAMGQIVGGPPFIEAWVDPCNGSDPLGEVGRQDRPYLTIGAAITDIELLGPSAGMPGLIHCDPGVYSAATNGEILPIVMADYINLQGVGAKRCVIRGGGATTVPTWFPIMAGGTFAFREVLVLLTGLDLNDYEEMIDGFTFQGGAAQVYAEPEAFDISARISNCVFDMLGGSDTGLSGPEFGVLMVHTFDLAIYNNPELRSPPMGQEDTTIEPGYWDTFLHLFNNTFIQGWAPTPEQIFTAASDSVAICDVANTLRDDPRFPPPAIPDPENLGYRGVGNLNIQNNLIRYIQPEPRTAMLGIDNGDVTASLATVLGPSNAFDPTAVGGINGTYESFITGLDPTAKVLPIPGVPNPDGLPQEDPAFVGEYLSSSLMQTLSTSRDWRILPDSVLVDEGTSPDAAGVLQAGNGTTYGRRLPPEWSFDFDGEYYGNYRRQGDEVDIGFDETDMMIVCGGYGNDSRSHGSNVLGCSASCTPVSGQDLRTLIFREPGFYDMYQNSALMPFNLPLPPGGYFWAWTVQFGSLLPPVFYGSSIPGYPLSSLWIETASTMYTSFSGPVGRPISPSGPYIPPFDTVIHNFGVDRETKIAAGCSYLNEQAIYFPASGGSGLTNLQWSYMIGVNPQ